MAKKATAVSEEAATEIAKQKMADAAKKKADKAAAKAAGDAAVKAITESGESEELVIEFEIPNNKTGLPKKTHVVPDNELNHGHVYIEQIAFDPQSGDRRSEGYVQKYDDRGWENARKYLPSQGWTLQPVYLPEGWPSEIEPLTKVGTVQVRDQKPGSEQ